MEISIHALREEGDRQSGRPERASRPFLSTPSARRATAGVLYLIALHFISIHALREEGDARNTGAGRRCSISIHALREEGDKCSMHFTATTANFYPRPPRGGRRSVSIIGWMPETLFLSTPSARRATAVCNFGHEIFQFLSTPSARRATALQSPQRSHSIYFYPRPPRGGRRYESLTVVTHANISIHALREEGDASNSVVVRLR